MDFLVFLFNEGPISDEDDDNNLVVLTSDTPDWMGGYINGICGDKIPELSTRESASKMVEEVLDIRVYPEFWVNFCNIHAAGGTMMDGAKLDPFICSVYTTCTRKVTKDLVRPNIYTVKTNNLPETTYHSAKWLIPMCMDLSGDVRDFRRFESATVKYY